MSETAGWAFAVIVASIVLLSLGAAPGSHEPRLAPSAPPVAVGQPDTTISPSALLADAYFRVAREAPGLESGFDGWYVLHEITVKGMAAQRGENPVPEEPESHLLQPADEPEFSRAGHVVEDWRTRLEATRPCPPALTALTARLQVDYDWWLLLAEAGAPQKSLETARHLYEETRSQLTAQSKIAAL